MPAECIFCGGRPTTNEHIIPEWMSRVLRQDPRGDLPVRLPYYGARLSGEGDLLREYETAHPVISVTANAACGPCNHGWMEKIEDAARPLLTDMVLGKAVSLDKKARKAIATWISLKAIMSTYTGLVPVEPQWIDLMYRRHIPPPTWYIWLASYDGKVVQYDETHDVVNRYLMRATRRAHGILMSAVIGYLAFKLLGVYKNPLREPAPTDALRIWPRLATPNALIWPPGSTLGDEAIARFFEMYYGPLSIRGPSGIRHFIN